MNEAEWLSHSNVGAMLDYLESRASPRKLRLFACAACRRYWSRLGNPSVRNAVTIAERFADDEVGVGELEQAQRRAQRALGGPPEFDAYAYQAAAAVVAEDALEAARTAIDSLRRQAVLDAANEVVPGMPGEDSATANAAASNAELQAQAELLREVIGNPFRRIRVERAWVAWNNGTTVALAREILEERRFRELPYLGDALEDAGCTNEAILRHCREDREHVRGCWVLDLILGGQ